MTGTPTQQTSSDAELHINLDTCGRELREPLRNELRTGSDLSCEVSRRKVQAGSSKDVLDGCVNGWIDRTIRPWTRDAIRKHLELAHKVGATAAQAWPWAQRRVASIMVETLAPLKVTYQPGRIPDEIDFAAGSDKEKHQRYLDLTRGWLQRTWKESLGCTLPFPDKNQGEGNREYMERMREFREEKWHSEQAANAFWDDVASRFAKAVEAGINDAQQQPHMATSTEQVSRLDSAYQWPQGKDKTEQRHIDCARTVARIYEELATIKPQMAIFDDDYSRLSALYPDYLLFSICKTHADLRGKVKEIGKVLKQKHTRLALEITARYCSAAFTSVDTWWNKHKPPQYRTIRKGTASGRPTPTHKSRAANARVKE